MRYVLAAVGLTAVYALTLGSAKALDLAFGTVLAVVLIAGTRRFVFPDDPDGIRAGRAGAVQRVLAFPPFAVRVALEVAHGTVEVALVVLGLRPLADPGLVAIPVGERTRAGVAVSALTASLSPGAVLINIDEERGEMLLHVLDARDPEAVRARHDELYARWQRRVFP
jgi:multicomponent Na+:H+ antiporter subunit E